MKRPKQHFDLVEVIWEDATELDTQWLQKDEAIDVEAEIVISCGFLVHKDKRHVVIALDTDGQGRHCGHSQIPRGMVKKIKVLRKKDAVA